MRDLYNRMFATYMCIFHCTIIYRDIMAVLKFETENIHMYNLISSSLTAEGVRTPRSVKRRVIYCGGV